MYFHQWHYHQTHILDTYSFTKLKMREMREWLIETIIVWVTDKAYLEALTSTRGQHYV